MLDADPEELIDYAARPDVAYGHKASMLQDVEARRQTEVDYLNGGIAEFGRKLGVPTPTHESIWALVKGVEAAWQAVMPTAEIDRRYGRIREAMARDGARRGDRRRATSTRGFEGAVTYMSGFVIVHRYAYVLLPLEGEPAIVFPREATYVGEHGTTWIDEQVFVDKPGEWLADQVRGKRVGVYGLDYVMTVRDYRALDGAAEIVPWDVEFDHARAVKSELELESVRDSVRINTEGFWIFLEHFAPGQDRARDPRALRAVLRRARAAAG